MIHLRNDFFVCWFFQFREWSLFETIVCHHNRHRTDDAQMFCIIINWLFVTLITGCVVQRNYGQLRTHRVHGGTEGTRTQDTYIVQNCRTIKSFGEWRFMNMIRWNSALMNPWDGGTLYLPYLRRESNMNGICSTARLKWNGICAVSVGRRWKALCGSPRTRRDYLMLDIVCDSICL